MSNINVPYPQNTENLDVDILEIDAGFLRYHTYPTPAEVLKYGLRGLPKRFPLTGEEIDEDYVGSFLASAIADIEMTGLIINPTIFTKQEDYHDGMMLKNFFPIILHRFPILDIESVIFIFPHASMPVKDQMLRYIVPKHWISWDRNKVNLIASTGPLLPQMTGTQYNTPLALWTNTNYRPNAYTVTWQAGFESDKLPYNVWKLLIDAAALRILMDVGPLLFPMSGMSVGIDGVAQSSQYPGHKLLESRINMLEQKVEKAKDIVLSHYGQRLKISYIGM